MRSTSTLFHRWLSLLLAAWIAGSWAAAPAQGDPDDAPVGYLSTEPKDPVARLQKQLDAGEKKLNYDSRFGYLPALLKNLNVPVNSQGLVFSKTSFQRNVISPHTPRALYFYDDSYIGYVPGAPVLEIASMDPKLGTNFYVLEQRQTSHPKLVRQTYDCMACHQSPNTRDVPGLLMRSVYPDLQGEPIQSAGTFISNEQSPLSERWGGWYVTGKCGKQTHMGNVICYDEEHADKTDFTGTSNLSNLDRRIVAGNYLQGSSDAVALMVVAHQTHLHNLMTAANYEVQAALRDSDAMNAALNRPAGDRTDGTVRRIQGACEPVVRAMLFCGEAKLDGGISGTTTFAADFSARGPRDDQGRSLRELDMAHRMFKYPCSYLIYSEQFDALPPAAQSYIYRRLWQILTGRDDDRRFDHLSDADREAVFDILRETKKGLPTYWKGKVVGVR